ncbi:MAG TPA: hypothetical protein VF618_22500 [Thermoanaerobaculia bacterium]
MSAVRAQELGYRNIRIMREGTKGWAALGYPLVRERDDAREHKGGQDA